jgi:hypothetical protein
MNVVVMGIVTVIEEVPVSTVTKEPSLRNVLMRGRELNGPPGAKVDNVVLVAK